VIADRASHTVVAAALLGCLLVAGAAAAGDVAAGARLAAARCASCHSSTDTTHSAVPLLEGQPKAYFIAQWRAFRERERTAPLMVSLASELSEQEVDDLSQYYAIQVPAQAVQSSANCRPCISRSVAMCQAATVRRCKGRTSARHDSPGKRRVTPPGRCS
jgi:cytochrome c553